MKFGSVCSGIEAASQAWRPLGWEAQWFSEIEPFPCAVLAHHYPTTPNLGDMTKFAEWPEDEAHAIDLLCGGTPCQSFSVAGLRKGLDDPRGNLMLTFGAIAAKYRPQWLVWENVPGVLSSNGGRDFGSFLGLLGVLGYGFAYRVLDAQYFGVAQRRRRVFVVGCLGDWRAAAAVLFERHSLSGYPAPRREAGKAAPTIPSRSSAGGGLGTDFDCDGGIVSIQGNLIGRDAGGPVGVGVGGPMFTLTKADVHAVSVPHALISPALKARDHKGVSSDGDGDGDGAILVPMLAHSLRGEGFDASEDGTGRGTPLVPVAFTQNSRSEVRLIGGDGGVVGALAAEPGEQQQNYVAYPAIAFPANLSGTQHASTENLASALGAKNPTAVAIQGENNASSYEADASSVLSTLRDKVGAEAVAQWGSRILDSLHSPEVLRSWLRGEGVFHEDEDFRSFVEHSALSREEGVPARALRQVWEHGPDGRTPQGRGLAKQLAFELGEALPRLPSLDAFGEDTVRHLRERSQGVRVLRETLSAIQAVGGRAGGQDQPACAGYQVRRLTPREYERLMGFPDGYTAIPWRTYQEATRKGISYETMLAQRGMTLRGPSIEECPDGPRYKALGNSWAVPNVRWIGERIDLVDQLLTERKSA